MHPRFGPNGGGLYDHNVYRGPPPFSRNPQELMDGNFPPRLPYGARQGPSMPLPGSMFDLRLPRPDLTNALLNLPWAVPNQMNRMMPNTSLAHTPHHTHTPPSQLFRSNEIRPSQEQPLDLTKKQPSIPERLAVNIAFISYYCM